MAFLARHPGSWIMARLEPFTAAVCAVKTRCRPERLSGLAQSIRALAVELKALVAGVEPDFLDLGQHLERIYADAGGLADQTRRIIGALSANDANGLLVKLGDLAQNAVAQLDVSQTQVRDNLNQIVSVANRLETIGKSSAEATRLGMVLRVVGLNMGIEAARSNGGQAMFVVIANELKAFSAKVLAIAEAIAQESFIARHRLIDAQGSLSKDMAGLSTLTAEARSVVEATVEAIAALMNQAIQLLEEADGHSREVSQGVAQVVMGIQFHDSLSQRIGHIATALDEAAAIFDGGNGADLAHAASVMALQTAQLEAAVSEIDTVYREQQSAFDSIEAHVVRLTQGFTDIRSQPERSENAIGSFGALEGALAELKTLHDRGKTLIGDFLATAATASQCTERLQGKMGDIRNIRIETHMKALNAIINAAHMGKEGRTLEVLAQEIKTLSDQADDFATPLAAMIEAVADTVSGIQSKDETPEPTPAGFCLETGLQELNGALGAFHADAADAAGKVGQLETAIGEICRRLGFLPALAGQFTGALNRLQDFDTVLAPWKRQAPAKQTEALLNRYTMQLERDIHSRFSDDKPAAEASPALELFDDAAGHETGSQAARPVPEPEDMGDNVELF